MPQFIVQYTLESFDDPEQQARMVLALQRAGAEAFPLLSDEDFGVLITKVTPPSHLTHDLIVRVAVGHRASRDHQRFEAKRLIIDAAITILESYGAPQGTRVGGSVVYHDASWIEDRL